MNRRELGKKLFFAVVSSILLALALNNFLIPASVFGSGINGVAQLASTLLARFSPINIQTGWLILLFNLPIGWLGWVKIGRSFTVFSFLSAVLTSAFSVLLPIHALAANPLMNALVGGALTGLGVGYALRYGFSTGGMDIIAFVLAKTTGKTIGTLMLITNGIIVLVAGFAFSWAIALYTIISIFCMSRVVDSINTSQQKVTVMIVTQKSTALVQAIHQHLIRGITILPARGAYSHQESNVLMVVVTRYELYDIERAVNQTDPAAFVNVMNTTKVMGAFVDQRPA
ncbi:YitT family protein [Loigolactobacillus rennini]|uniref:Integral inner membrane protein n=1 Tax=Loigolactobacillus rennini DSM 20253 TaxID=1423796 RepID=A0A0R2D5I0_9LACO|nr:YitT family protein [Loigolactobacillus rennini]KRM98722.1 integral inner membrane protein [Loigolactobacillus rennini DSM 20253]